MKFQLKKIQHSILIIVNGDGEVDVVTFVRQVNEMKELPGRVMQTWLPCHGRFPESKTKSILEWFVAKSS